MRDPNTPTGGRAAARSRPVRFAVTVASVLTALGVLAAPALSPTASSAGELTFPYENRFDSGDGGTLGGDAVIDGGRLRLTDDVRRQAGSWSTDDTFPSDLGLEIEFEYAMWNDVGDTGADGLVLSLADGAAPQGVGAFGAALGYSCRHEISQGSEFPCDLPGLPGASRGSPSTSTATSPCRSTSRVRVPGRSPSWSAVPATASRGTATSTVWQRRAPCRPPARRRGRCG